MNKENIIRMALEAGFSDREESSHMFGRSRFDEEICVEEYAVGEMVERFAALVAAHEREECVRAAIDYHEIGWAVSCASAIRARSKATQDDVWAHPSMDGREKYETGERKPK